MFPITSPPLQRRRNVYFGQDEHPSTSECFYHPNGQLNPRLRIVEWRQEVHEQGGRRSYNPFYNPNSRDFYSTTGTPDTEDPTVTDPNAFLNQRGATHTRGRAPRGARHIGRIPDRRDSSPSGSSSSESGRSSVMDAPEHTQQEQWTFQATPRSRGRSIPLESAPPPLPGLPDRRLPPQVLNVQLRLLQEAQERAIREIEALAANREEDRDNENPDDAENADHSGNADHTTDANTRDENTTEDDNDRITTTHAILINSLLARPYQS
ncbi:hypothetical protein B0H63DRAFT_484153 [Podospora didyma]|uniref:Uncharacterized protein n=1 Tax=Podospora didyma TaxID=330526 RepID=A0AAE0KAA3_9PEZI|nr:hypothetical protein B0H63DRAFT_484153 [Podospora didyma]